MKFNLRKYSQDIRDNAQEDLVDITTSPMNNSSIEDQEKYQVEQILNNLFQQIDSTGAINNADNHTFGALRQSPYFNIVFDNLTKQYGDNTAIKVWEALGYNISEEGTAFTQGIGEQQVENMPEDVRIGEPSPVDLGKSSRGGILSNMQGLVETTPQYGTLVDQGGQRIVADDIYNKVQDIISAKRQMDTSGISSRVKGDKTSLYMALSENVSPSEFNSKIQAYLPEDLRQQFLDMRDAIDRKYNLGPYISRLLILADINSLQNIDEAEYILAASLGLAYNTGPYSRLVFRPNGESVIQKYTDKRLTWMFNHPESMPMELQMMLEQNVGNDWTQKKAESLSYMAKDAEANKIATNAFGDLLQNTNIKSTLYNWSSWYGLRELLKNILSEQVVESLNKDFSTEEELMGKDETDLKNKNSEKVQEVLKQINEIGDILSDNLKKSEKNPVSNFRLSQIIDIYKDLLVQSLERYVYGDKSNSIKNDEDIFSHLANRVTAVPINKRKAKIGEALKKAHEMIQHGVGGDSLVFEVARVLSDGVRPDMLNMQRAKDIIEEYKKYPLDQDDFLDDKDGWYYLNNKDIKTKLSESFGALREPLYKLYHSGKYDPRIIKSFMDAIKFKQSYFEKGNRNEQDKDLYEALISGQKVEKSSDREEYAPKHTQNVFEDDRATNYDEFEQDQAKMYGLASTEFIKNIIKLSQMYKLKNNVIKIGMDTSEIDEQIKVFCKSYFEIL